MTKRLFIAIDIPNDIKSTLVEIQNKLINIYGKKGCTNLNSLHLTLKFLGDTNKEKVSKIIENLELSLKNAKSFDLQLSEISGFPNINYPKIIICSLKPVDEISKLAKTVDNSLHLIGFEKEKRNFKPHITIFRPKFTKNPKIENVKIKGNLTVKSVKLYESVLKPDRAYYYELHKINLK